MQGTALFPTEKSARVRRNSLDFVAIFFGLVIVTVVALLVVWQFWHANRIYTGVQVAGQPIGGMTRLEALNHVNRTLQPYPLPPIILTYAEQQLPLTGLTVSSGNAGTTNAATTVDLISAVNRAYLLGRDESIPQQLQDQLLALLIGINVEPQVTFNRAQLRHAVTLAGEQLRQPARAPRLLDGQVVPGQDGVVVDVEATMQQLLDRLQSGMDESSMVQVPFVVQRILAESVSAAPLASGPSSESTGGSTVGSVMGSAELLPISTVGVQLPSVLLRGPGGFGLAIDPAALTSLLFSENPLRLDREKVSAYLTQWAARVNVEPRDARLQFNPTTGTVNILQTSASGRRLDVEATAQRLIEAVEGSGATGSGAAAVEANLVLNTVAPTVDMNRIPELGIRELVASGTSYFAGSSAARVRNIEVAAAKFEGVVIPPGEVFSFNNIVEDVSSANGFEDSLIIWGDQTAVGVGGGVCQVSTTIFRAAYEAGLPIVERYNHGYVVSWYGEPGLDATIYTPTVDFRFRNDTDAHLLVDPVVDSRNGVITFNLYGTKPNRQVVIAEPVVSEVIEPEPPKYRVDEELATGEREQVEWEKEGKTVEVTRTIIENGQSRTDTITSKYQPWQAVYLVGPGTLAEEGAEAQSGDSTGEQGIDTLSNTTTEEESSAQE